MQRESMQFDVVIVGAGPAGLSAAIRLSQLAQKNNHQVSICIVEKGSQVGAHILSGAVLDPCALNELLPDWKNQNAPVATKVSNDSLSLLTKHHCWHLPVPAPLDNRGNYIISLGSLCRWLADVAEQIGIEIYPGFAASDIVFDKKGQVCGITTGDMGLNSNGSRGPNYQAGINLMAKQVILAEGCRGSLTKRVQKQFNLRQQADAQTYALGFKEIWDISPQQHQQGQVFHSVGWPLDSGTYGGSFVYHLAEQQLVVGFIIGLDYKNPYLNPFAEFQRFKTHPTIRPLFKRAKRLGYGAKTLSEGGFQSIPRLSFPGGVLVGDAAGLLNVARIKGIHTAMKSGMLAAEAIFQALVNDNAEEVIAYPYKMKKSWIWEELKAVRNIRPGFHRGLWPGLCNAALETYLFQGRTPWTLHHHEDHKQLGKASHFTKIKYPEADGVIIFDRQSSVYLSNISQRDNQPCHLKIKNAATPIEINLKLYAAPEQRYCPAAVYEIIHQQSTPAKLQINAQNCIHCKACDIKDPTGNISWQPPEGGSGPNYQAM